MNLKEGWKKFWYLLWKDDSLKGWVFSFIFLFVFIKFIFFPGLALVTGTEMPLAIVESCSMYHQPYYLFFGNFGDWWEVKSGKYSPYGLTKEIFNSFTMHNGFNKGDILFTIRANPTKLRVGDIIIFQANQKNPVIHRIIKIESINGNYTFSTIGDNNNGQLEVEKNIKSDQLIGKAVFKIAPFIGWVKLIFYEWQKAPSERGFCKQN